MNAIMTHITGAIEELHHVRWPTRQQAVRLSTIVLIFTLVAALLFGLLDALLSQAIDFILSYTTT